MADRVDVSVIIVKWNTRDLPLDVIDSVKTTTYSVRIRVIVVDNASDDGSAAAVRQIFPNVTVIVNPHNYGLGRANTIGLQAARGDAFCLVNTDIVALDDVMDELWTSLRTHPRVGAVGPRTLDRDGNVRRNGRRFPSLRNALGDHLWLRYVLSAGWDCVYDAQARAVRLGGASTATHPLTYHLEMAKADLRYWREHHGRSAVASSMAIPPPAQSCPSLHGRSFGSAVPNSASVAGLKLKGSATNAAWLLGLWGGTAHRSITSCISSEEDSA